MWARGHDDDATGKVDRGEEIVMMRTTALLTGELGETSNDHDAGDDLSHSFSGRRASERRRRPRTTIAIRTNWTMPLRGSWPNSTYDRERQAEAILPDRNSMPLAPPGVNGPSSFSRLAIASSITTPCSRRWDPYWEKRTRKMVPTMTSKVTANRRREPAS